MDHVGRSAQGHVGSIVLGSSLNVALNLHRVKERLGLLAAEGRRIRGVEEACARPTPLQAESGVICLTGNSTIHLRCLLPFAQNQISGG